MSNSSNDILFGKFEIIECLKKDSHTSVFLANHVYLGKKILLKTLCTSELPDPAVLDRFKREAKILASLDHPNLIKVLDFGTFDNYFYISFEYFESKNLKEFIEKNSPNEEESKELLVQILKALNVAHVNNIVHRDIKPENILVNSELQLKIADFGLAFVSTENAVTQNSSILGTPGYMAPEQIRGEKATSADLFSAGIVAFEMFTGKNPFWGNSVGDTMNNILNFKEIGELEDSGKIPGPVKEAISRLLVPDPDKRARSASEVLKLLGITEEPLKPLRKKRKLSTKKKIIFYILPLAVTLLVILVYVFGRNIYPGVETEKPVNNNDGTKTGLTAVQNNEKKSTPSIKDKTADNAAGTKDDETKSKSVPVSANSDAKGYLYVQCLPWADVYVDSEKVDRTPLSKPVELKEGRHLIKISNSNFPPLYKKIRIRPGQTDSISINLTNSVGYVDCKVYPWGYVYINDKYLNITPLDNPIKLFPGKYTVTVKNPKFITESRTVEVEAKKTSNLMFNLDRGKNE